MEAVPVGLNVTSDKKVPIPNAEFQQYPDELSVTTAMISETLTVQDKKVLMALETSITKNFREVHHLNGRQYRTSRRLTICRSAHCAGTFTELPKMFYWQTTHNELDKNSVLL